MKICVIYKITSPTGRIYIGQTKDFKRRLRLYKNLNCKSQTRLYQSFLKHGFKNHKFEIIERCELNLLNERERYWQEHYDVLGKKGLNCFLTPTFDKKYTFRPETINVIKEKRNKRVISEETCRRISRALKGVPKSKEHVDKVAKALRGYKHTEASKQNMSNGQKGKKLINDHSKKQVIRISDGHVFNSLKEASYEMNINYSVFRNKLNGTTKTNNTGCVYLAGKTKRGQVVEKMETKITPEGLRILTGGRG